MILVADPDRTFLERVGAALQRPDGLVQLESLEDVDRAFEASASRITVVVLGPGIDYRAGLERVERIVRAPHYQAEFILVQYGTDADTLRAALRAGARDVLPVDFEEAELKDAVTRAEDLALARHPSEALEGVDGKVVTVFSTKGGCGKSLIATNLAMMLNQRTHGNVTLVDMDLQSGDLAIMLQLLPALSIYEASQSPGRLDAESLGGYLTPHRSGVSVLAAPTEPSLADAVSPTAVTRVLELLRQTHEYVIVDGPPFFTDQILPALDMSDAVLVIGSMDVPSVKNLRLALTTLDQLGVSREKVHVVLNRADTKVGLRTAEVEKSLGAKIEIMIPSSRDVPLSINQGNPLAVSQPDSPVIEALMGLLPIVTGGTLDSSSPTVDKGRGGLLSRFRN
jgi:pilus assembly protein CpaE